MSVLAIIFIAVALIAGVVAGFVIANSRLNQSSVQAKENLVKEAEVAVQSVGAAAATLAAAAAASAVERQQER